MKSTTPSLPSALAVLGLTPAKIAEWRAQGFGRATHNNQTSIGKIERAGATAAIGDCVISNWVDVTPAMATAWLKNNFGNRKLKEDVITAYVRDMLNGVWVPTHQGIAFNDEERLVDGQHRLTAIERSGCTVRMMVTFGLPSKITGQEMTTMDCVDRGLTRSVPDQLTIQHGFKNGSIIASICAAIASICAGERTRRLSVGQTLNVFRAFEPSIQFVIEHKSKQPGLKTAGVLAAFAFAMGAEDCMMDVAAKTKELFDHLNVPDVNCNFPTIALLRAFLTSEEAKLFSRSLDRGLAELTLQAIHLELLGKRVEKLELLPDGVNYFRAQQKERVAKIAGLFVLPTVKKVEPVAGAKPDAVLTPAQPAAVAAAPSMPAKDRPTLEKILSKVEAHTQISNFILTGRGSDAEITTARILFIAVARSFGHTPEAIANKLKKPPVMIVDLTRTHDALTEKQKKAVETIKGKL